MDTQTPNQTSTPLPQSVTQPAVQEQVQPVTAQSTTPNTTPPATPTVAATPTAQSVPPAHKKNVKMVILAIAFFVFLAGAAIYISVSLQSAKPTTSVQAAPKKIVQQPLFLNLESPKGAVTAVAGEILVKGKTLPNTTILAYSDADETSVDSDSQGNFETSVIVGDNGGLIRISAISSTGEEKTETVNIGDSQNLSYMGTSVLGKTSDTSGNSNKPEKLDQPNTKAMIADTKKDDKQMPNNTTTIASPGNKKTKEGPTLAPEEQKQQEIKTFQSTSQTKKPAKLGVKALKEIESTTSTDSAELTKKQIKKLTSTEASSGAQLKKHAIFGVITAIGNGQITIAHQIQNERIHTVYYNDSTVVSMKDNANATITDLTTGMRVAVMGTPVDDILLASHIHIIPGKAIGVMNKQPGASSSAGLSTTPEATPSGTLSPTATPSASLTPTDAVETLTPPPTTTEPPTINLTQ